MLVLRFDCIYLYSLTAHLEAIIPVLAALVHPSESAIRLAFPSSKTQDLQPRCHPRYIRPIRLPRCNNYCLITSSMRCYCAFYPGSPFGFYLANAIARYNLRRFPRSIPATRRATALARLISCAEIAIRESSHRCQSGDHSNSNALSHIHLPGSPFEDGG
jgi:hypothetical protein